MKNLFAILTLSISALTVSAQTPTTTQAPQAKTGIADLGITPTFALGEITAIDAANNQISLKTKDGDISAALNAATEYKKVSPENPTDLKAATLTTLGEIGIGDRIIAQGKTADDKKSIATRRVYVMTKADITKRQTADRDEWTKNGIAGRVTAVNAANNEITVATRGLGGSQSTIVKSTDKTIFRRYAAGSVKFNDAVVSSVSTIQVGDQLRARGAKNVDGSEITVAEVVSGTFKMIAGKIEAIDLAKSEVTIKDQQTAKSVVITVGKDTLLRKFTPERAQMLAMMQNAQSSGQPTITMEQGGRPPRSNPNAAQMPSNSTGGGDSADSQPRQPRRNGMMRTRETGGDVDSMVEKLPGLTLSELKIGDAIAVSSTSGADANRVTAIKLVAGVEPFLTAPQQAAGNRNQGGSQGSFSVPGLDGIGAP
ncbi:MAG: hypothetical protein H7Z37_18845 [Pyrinomonadaceae bacterium]|nr:hypothetical protein [Pyrinomonadaceae bacterium]